MRELMDRVMICSAHRSIGRDVIPTADSPIVEVGFITHGIGSISTHSCSSMFTTVTPVEIPIIPTFVDRAFGSCRSILMYADGSSFSEAVIKNILFQVPVVLTSKLDDVIASTSCLLIMAFINIRSFVPAALKSYITILLTGEIEVDDSILSRYSRKNLFWVSGMLYKPIIRVFDQYETLENIDDTTASIMTENMFPKSLPFPNFKGKKFLIGITNYTIYSEVRRRKDGTWAGSGIEYDFIHYICTLLNLTEILIPIPLGNVSSRDEVISRVLNQEVDVGIGGVWLSPTEVNRNEFIDPWDLRCCQYLVPRPKRTVESFLLLPFQLDMWITICVAIFIGGIIKTIFARLFDDGAGRRYKSLKWSLYATLMHMLLRYYPRKSEYASIMRPLFVSWSWLSVLLTAAYTNQLTAIFVTPQYEQKAQTMKEFVANGYHWGNPQHPVSYQICDDSVCNEWIGSRFLREESVQDRNLRMSHGNYVIPGESYGKFFYFSFTQHMPDPEVVKNYEVAGRCFAVFYTGQLFPIGSPFSRVFNKVVDYLRNSDIKLHLKRRYFSRHEGSRYIPPNVFTFSASNKTKEFSPMKLSQFRSVFMILSVGMISAAVIFIIEVSSYRFLTFKKNGVNKNRTLRLVIDEKTRVYLH